MTKKISELNAAVEPLTGDEDVLLVQAGVTRRAQSSALARVLFAGIMEPSSLGSGTTDDLVLAEIQTRRRVRVNSSADTAILAGIAGGEDGMTLMVTNNGLFMITIGDEAGTSDAENRFAMNGDAFLMPGQSAWFIYDDSILRWSKVGI